MFRKGLRLSARLAALALISAYLIPVVGNPSAKAATTTSGLVFHYDAFNANSYSGSGTALNDLSGNGQNATLQNGVGYSASNGKALTFDGVNDYVALPSISTDFSTGFSATFYANFGTADNWERILDLGNGTADNNILVGRFGTTNDLFVEFFNGLNVRYGKCIAAGIINDNTWAHYAITANGTSCYIYKNGVAQTTKIADTGTALDNTNTSSFPYLPNTITRTSNFIGKSNWSADSYFNGSIGEVSVYNKALNASEVKDNYISQVEQGSIQFTGSNYLSYPASSDYNFGTGDFTVEWWQKYSTSGGGAAPIPFSIGCYSSNRLQVSIESGYAYVAVGSAWSLSPALTSTTYQNVWANFSLVRRSGVLSLYLNGSSIASASNTTSLDLSASKLFVGTEDPACYSTTKFAGLITNFRIVKSALHSGNFDPELNPSVAANTIIQLQGNTDAPTTDSSTYNRTVTNTGSVASSTNYPVKGLSLSASTISATRGTAITSLTSSYLGGTPSSYSISPALPSGLTFNTSTGTVSGTPTVGLSSTTFTVTANGVSTFNTATFTLAVAATTLSTPSTPTGYAVSGSASSIVVSYTSVTNATSHTVRVYQTDGTTLVGSARTSFTSGSTITGLSPGTNYKISVQAVGDGVSYNSSSESTQLSVTTNPAAVTPTFTTQPSDATKGAGITNEFRAKATVTDSGTVTYLWQKSTDGVSWTDLTAGTDYYSSYNYYTTPTLILANNGTKYRVIATNTKNGTTATATSNVATLTVPNPPAISGAYEIIHSPNKLVYASGETATITYTLKCSTAQLYGPSFYDMVGYEGGPSWSYNNSMSSGTTNDGGYTWTIAGTYLLNTNGTWWSNPYMRGACLDSYNFTYPSKIYLFVGIPGVTSLSATVGSPSGGDSITITGNALDTVTSVTFGGTAGTITSQSSTSLTVTTPAHVAANYQTVVVTNANGSQSKYSDSGRSTIYFNYVLAPAISGLSITGTTNVGNTLTASATITGTSPTTTYQWQQSLTSGGTFTNISGATSSTYAVPHNLSGRYLKVIVTSTNAAGTATSTSSETARIGNAVYLDLVPSVYAGGGATTWSSAPSTTSSGVTLRNTPTFTSSNGSASGYFTFDGASSQWLGDNTGANNPTTFSVGLWFRAQNGAQGKLIGFENNLATAGSNYDRMIYIGTDGKLHAGVWGTGATNKDSLARVDDGSWHYVVFTYGSSSVNLYIDGSAQGTAVTGASFNSYTNPSYWKIGGTVVGGWPSAGQSFFTGDIGRVTIYSSVLSSTNVTTYYNADSASYPNLAPTLTGATISGTETLGQTLTASVSGAGGGAPTSTTYQWSSASTSGGTYSNIVGATGSTYLLTSNEVGKYVKVTITVSNSGGSNNATSAATGAIANIAPTIGSAIISGTPTSGQTLTASSGSVGGGAATSTTYQWRISADNSSFTDIAGANGSTYSLTLSDVSKYIKVVITLSNLIGSNSATSNATSQVGAPVAAPTLTGVGISGTQTQGQTLTASVQGAGGGLATSTTYQWSRADSAGGTYSIISGATSSSYTLVSADAGKYLKATITLSNLSGSNSATSNATGAIALIAPTIASASISGTTTLGQVLTAVTGSLGGGAVASTAYQWKSSSTSNGTYSDISGATSSTYTLTSGEVGKFIKVLITVSNLIGSATATSNPTNAAVISNLPVPTVTTINKNAGTTAGGNSVTISGTNLSTITSVTFGGSAATISSKSSTSAVVVVPAGSVGAVDVVVTNPSGSVTSTNGYTYVTAPTTRSWSTSVSRTTASPGDSFTVTYTAVCTTPQTYGPSMYDLIYYNASIGWTFNTYMGSGTSTDGGYTWTITKNYTLPNTNNVIYKIDAYERGACWDSYNFTYATQKTINVGVSGPAITSLNTTSGPTAGGTAVTITGTTLTGVTGITVGGVSATSIRSNTSTSVTFNVPAGTAGAKDVVVTTPAGSATSNGAFTYIAPSTITYNVNTADSGTPSRTSDSYSPNTGGYSLPTVGTMVKTGYTFGGWATANNSSTPVTNPYNPQNSLTLYAIWTVNNYSTTYNANGATSGTVPNSTSNAFGATVTVANNTGSLARTGYTLAGWNTLANGTGTSYILNSGQYTQGASNLILYADWVPNTYTVSYDVNGSSDATPSSHTGVLANGTVTLSSGITKAGYAFVGWTYNSVTYAAGATFTIGSADAQVVAKWIAVYTLSYNLNGTGASGTVPADHLYASGDPVTVDSGTPTRSGYTFGGWKDQSNVVHAAGSNYNISSSNYLLYAVWTPVAYTVTYALNGGSGTAPTESSKNINDTFVVASAPTKTGYTFTGWSNGSTVYGAGSTYLVATSNITLTAQWSANSYAISYDLAQGTSTVPSGVSKAYQASWTLPDTPTRVGYTFADWYDGTSGYAAGATYTLNSANDLTLTARWTAIVYYTVTYDLDGGLGTAPTQDPLQNGQSFNLAADPSKTGNSFAGWSYANATYTSGSTITMPASNITITALWTATSAGTYAITYITNGAQTAAPTVPSLAQNATFVVDDGSTLIKNGYIFSGWSYGGNTYTGGETITMPAASVTLSAIWVPSVRATAVSQSVDSTSITRGRSITVSYSLGCYNSSNTTPTITENVTSSGESFINDISGSLTVVDAGYNWTVTRVYTLSFAGTYTIFATASGGCFVASTDSTSNTVTVTEAPSNSGGGNSNSNNSSNSSSANGTGTGSIPPVTVVGAKIALVANKFYTLPKLAPKTTLSVEAKTGASASTTSTSTTNGNILTTTTMLSVNSASKGLSEVKIVENQLAVVPTVGFSGNTSVTVTVTDGATTSQIQVPVTVLPEAVKDPTLTPKTGTSTVVTWDASPNATNYQVFVDGKAVCKTSGESCTVPKILGPNANVDVVANGGDATKSEVADAEYLASSAVTVAKISGTYGKSTLSKNDLTNLNKVIATINKQGFENVQITGITTTKLTATAANARLDAMVSYIQEKVANPDLIIKVVAPTTRTFTNQIAVK